MNTKMHTSVIKKTSAIFLAVSSLMLSATAFDAKAIEVAAHFSCGDWVQERKIDSARQILFRRWILGYLSGLASGLGKDILKGTGNESIYLWIDNFCQANPLKDSDDAANELFRELVKVKRL